MFVSECVVRRTGCTGCTAHERGNRMMVFSGCGCAQQGCTHFPVLHTIPDCFYDSGALHSHYDGWGGQRFVQSLSAHQLGEVQPARLDAHQDLSSLQLGLVLRLHLQLHLVVAAVPRQDQSPPGERLDLGCRAAPRPLRRSSRRRLLWFLLLIRLLLLSWSFFFSRHDNIHL